MRTDWVQFAEDYDEMTTAVVASAESSGDDALELPDGAVDSSTDASPFARFRRRFFADKVSLFALFILVVIVLGAVFATWLTPFEPEATDAINRFQSPSRAHWLGTDDLGRDTFTRLLYAGRVSLAASLLAVVVAVGIGAPLGLLAGYLGGRWDGFLSRSADLLMSLPSLILALGIIAAVGPGLVNAMIALGVVYSPRIFRIVRGATLGVAAETYIEASVSIGLQNLRIIRRHVLPNVMSPLLVQISLMMALSLLAEASLSFLGLGAQPPTASWGVMLGRAYFDIRTYPTGIYWPGIAIALTSLSWNLIGDGLRDALGREVRKGTG